MWIDRATLTSFELATCAIIFLANPGQKNVSFLSFKFRNVHSTFKTISQMYVM